jgi:hypothetical protein
MLPRLTSSELAALQPGDRVSRLASSGVWETASVQRVTATRIAVTWPDGTSALYSRESGRRQGCHGEQLREPEPDPRMSPERWREVLYVHLREAMFRHLLSAAEERDLTTALTDDSTEAYRVLHECARVCFEPMDAAALIVGTVLVRRLAEASVPTIEETLERQAGVLRRLAKHDTSVPDWALGVIQ